MMTLARLTAPVAMISLLSIPPYAHAAPSERRSETYSERFSDTAKERARLERLVERHEVKQQLVAFGVSEIEAKERLAALSDAEVQALGQNLAAAPAGGDSTITIGVGTAIIIALLLIIFL